MTPVEALAIAAPLVAAAALGSFVLVTNYFDDKATAKRQKQKQADAARQTTNSVLFLSGSSEAEREQLKLHIETLEAFAETVKNAGAIVEESSRRIHTTAVAQPSLEDEKR